MPDKIDRGIDHSWKLGDTLQRSAPEVITTCILLSHNACWASQEELASSMRLMLPLVPSLLWPGAQHFHFPTWFKKTFQQEVKLSLAKNISFSFTEDSYPMLDKYLLGFKSIFIWRLSTRWSCLSNGASGLTRWKLKHLSYYTTADDLILLLFCLYLFQTTIHLLLLSKQSCWPKSAQFKKGEPC